MPFLNNGSGLPSDGERGFNAFEKLVEDLSSALGPSSGLDSDDVDPINIQQLMEKYISNSSEWGSYALGDASRAYTRNLIDEGNGKSNLVSQPASGSPAFSPQDNGICWKIAVLTHALVAHSCVVSREGKRHSRPCECTLCHEGKQPWLPRV